MRVFIDTEFTDFTNPELISCGLVAENGAEFYAELTDGWIEEHCSPFVTDIVLSHLNQTPGVKLSRRLAGQGLMQWLTSLDKHIDLIFDVDVDNLLLTELLKPHRTASLIIESTQLSWPGSAMARNFEILLAQALSNEPMRHHALVDARAMRQAVLQTEAEFRA